MKSPNDQPQVTGLWVSLLVISNDSFAFLHLTHKPLDKFVVALPFAKGNCNLQWTTAIYDERLLTPMSELLLIGLNNCGGMFNRWFPEGQEIGLFEFLCVEHSASENGQEMSTGLGSLQTEDRSKTDVLTDVRTVCL